MSIPDSTSEFTEYIQEAVDKCLKKEAKMRNLLKMSVEEENYRLGVSYVIDKLEKAYEKSKNPISLACTISKLIQDERNYLNER